MDELDSDAWWALAESLPQSIVVVALKKIARERIAAGEQSRGRALATICEQVAQELRAALGPRYSLSSKHHR